MPVVQRKSDCGGICPACQSNRPDLQTSPYVQAKLRVGPPDDNYEREANRVADKVMRMPEPSVQRQTKSVPGAGTPSANPPTSPRLSALRGIGEPLPAATRGFFEPRFDEDFGGVRIHRNGDAIGATRALHARAFTVGHDVVFGAGEFAPGTRNGQALIAHELVHVTQQCGSSRRDVHDPRSMTQRAGAVVQRFLELRPPGRGEASAFEQRDELIVRLNAQSAAVSYRLDGRRIECDVVSEVDLTHFDRQMMGFIDNPPLIPMRLITGAGRVLNRPITADSFVTGYVDLDDLVAADDIGFQSVLIHFLTERAVVQNYVQLLGTRGLFPAFARAHRAGHDAQAEHFRALTGDPSIVFNRQRNISRGEAQMVFRSRNEGYRIFVRFRRLRADVVDIDVRVRQGSETFSFEEFLARRAPAAAAAPVALP